MAGVEPQNLSQYVQELKDRFNHVHLKMVQQEKSAIDLETCRKHGRQTTDFQEGDVVYMFLATIKLNLSWSFTMAFASDWERYEEFSRIIAKSLDWPMRK